MNRRQEERAGWSWFAIGHWVLGVGLGSASVMNWPALAQWRYLPLWIVIAGYVLIHGPGRKRGDE